MEDIKSSVESPEFKAVMDHLAKQKLSLEDAAREKGFNLDSVDLQSLRELLSVNE